MSPLDAVATVLVGVAAGALSGMFGVGGAVVTTPGIRVLGATPIESVGSTIPAILPGALSAAWRYSRSGLVAWRLALTAGVVGSGFAVLGAVVSDAVDAHLLMLLTAAILLVSGVRNVVSALRLPGGGALATAIDPDVAVEHDTELDLDADRPEPSGPAVPMGAELDGTDAPLAMVAPVGAAAGFLAGLLGVGGGILLVPAFTGLLRIAPKRAVASSLVAVAIFSIPAMVTHARLGHINWAFALLLAVGVLPGAQLGARLTIGGSDRRLRTLMGVFFALMAVLYGGRELREL